MIENFRNYECKTWQEIYNEYKERFEEKYPVAFSILEIGGVHPDKNEPMVNPYLCDPKLNEPGCLDNEDFRNIGEHCVSVAICADKIARYLIKKGAIDENVRAEVIGRALIHDANKRFEIFRRKAREKGLPVEVYNKRAYDTMYEKVIENGLEINKSLAEYLKNAGKETGHSSLTDFVTLDENGEIALKRDLTIEEIIVHLSDDMTASPLPDKTKNSEIKFVTTEERMELGNFPNRYGFLYKEGFGFDKNNNPIIVKDAFEPQKTSDLKSLKTYAEWQRIIAAKICKQLQGMMGHKNQDDPEEFIKNLVNCNE